MRRLMTGFVAACVVLSVGCSSQAGDASEGADPTAKIAQEPVELAMTPLGGVPDARPLTLVACGAELPSDTSDGLKLSVNAPERAAPTALQKLSATLTYGGQADGRAVLLIGGLLIHDGVVVGVGYGSRSIAVDLAAEASIEELFYADQYEACSDEDARAIERGNPDDYSIVFAARLVSSPREAALFELAERGFAFAWDDTKVWTEDSAACWQQLFLQGRFDVTLPMTSPYAAQCVAHRITDVKMDPDAGAAIMPAPDPAWLESFDAIALTEPISLTEMPRASTSTLPQIEALPLACWEPARTEEGSFYRPDGMVDSPDPAATLAGQPQPMFIEYVGEAHLTGTVSTPSRQTVWFVAEDGSTPVGYADATIDMPSGTYDRRDGFVEATVTLQAITMCEGATVEQLEQALPSSTVMLRLTEPVTFSWDDGATESVDDITLRIQDLPLAFYDE